MAEVSQPSWTKATSSHLLWLLFSTAASSCHPAWWPQPWLSSPAALGLSSANLLGFYLIAV